ncbi:hypothetical protein V6N13_075163 [Hibiscus sabdariffa]
MAERRSERVVNGFDVVFSQTADVDEKRPLKFYSGQEDQPIDGGGAIHERLEKKLSNRFISVSRKRRPAMEVYKVDFEGESMGSVMVRAVHDTNMVEVLVGVARKKKGDRFDYLKVEKTGDERSLATE